MKIIFHSFSSSYLNILLYIFIIFSLYISLYFNIYIYIYYIYHFYYYVFIFIYALYMLWERCRLRHWPKLQVASERCDSPSARGPMRAQKRAYDFHMDLKRWPRGETRPEIPPLLWLFKAFLEPKRPRVNPRGSRAPCPASQRRRSRPAARSNCPACCSPCSSNLSS